MIDSLYNYYTLRIKHIYPRLQRTCFFFFHVEASLQLEVTSNMKEILVLSMIRFETYLLNFLPRSSHFFSADKSHYPPQAEDISDVFAYQRCPGAQVGCLSQYRDSSHIYGAANDEIRLLRLRAGSSCVSGLVSQCVFVCVCVCV